MTAFESMATENLELLDAINPASYTTAENGSWVFVGLYHRLVAEMNVGLIAGAGTLDFKLQQADSSAGANAKDITSAAITQLAASDDNVVVAIELQAEDLDNAETTDFAWVRMVITPAVAASLASATLKGYVGRFLPVPTTNYEEVIQL